MWFWGSMFDRCYVTYLILFPDQIRKLFAMMGVQKWFSSGNKCRGVYMLKISTPHQEIMKRGGGMTK